MTANEMIDLRTEAAIWSAGTDYSPADLVRLYLDYADEMRRDGVAPCSPQGFFRQELGIENT